MKDNAVVFLTCSRKESRYVYQRYDRNIECIAETNETCTLTRCVAVEHTSQILRLISNDTYRLSVETGETDDDILCIIFLDFKEFTVVHNSADHYVDEYRGKQVPAGKKSLTLRLAIGSKDKTLTSAEIEEVASGVLNKIAKRFGAELRR